MTISFIDWAMRCFNGYRFGICGKTVDSCVKNIVMPYLATSYARERYTLRWKRSEKTLEVSRGYCKNVFEIFGGKDESSAALIQGRTLAGVLLDEVVLMPESFVNQALARCSVDGARLWFSCNPGPPSHWFYTEWIKRHEEHNALYLHFTMQDNPSLSEKTLALYKSMYPPGVFYERYVLGLWVMAEGLIYPMYQDAIAEPPEGKPEDYRLSIDYGTMNAFAALLWGKYGSVWYALDEYYYSGRDEMTQKTNGEYADDLDRFTNGLPFNQSRKLKTIIDPSATAFITELRKRPESRYQVIPADNDVIPGIQDTASCMQKGLIKISPRCKNLIREMQGYVWDENDGEDRPVKVDDHAADALRYFCRTMKIARPKQKYVPLYMR